MQVQSYDNKTQKLQLPYNYKVKKLLLLGCVVKINPDYWQCRPIRGYNTTTYDLKRDNSGGFKCNCQGFQKYNNCSHLKALLILLDKEGDQKQGNLF